jgi:hypothetical protein
MFGNTAYPFADEMCNKSCKVVHKSQLLNPNHCPQNSEFRILEEIKTETRNERNRTGKNAGKKYKEKEGGMNFKKVRKNKIRK